MVDESRELMRQMVLVSMSSLAVSRDTLSASSVVTVTMGCVSEGEDKVEACRLSEASVAVLEGGGRVSSRRGSGRGAKRILRLAETGEAPSVETSEDEPDAMGDEGG